jgi:type II secretory pathway pseudopilin PulG
MAARETQGIQAIIISLVILTLLLTVGLFFVNNARKTAVARANDAQTQLSSANAAQAKLQAEANDYKLWMGFNEGDGKEALDAAFKSAMERYAATMPEESRNYGAVLDNIFEENRKLVLNETNAKAEAKDLKDRLTAVEAQAKAQIDKFSAEMKKAADDAAAAKKQFDEQYATINAEKEEIKKDLQEKLAEIDKIKEQMQSVKADSDVQAAKFERSIAKLREGLPEVDQFAQPADGRLTWVNQKHRNVWINLGSADGLRPQVTFSVSAEGLGDAEAAEKKGSIEVVRIIGPHMAEARISEDEATNPLIPGDRIYSQVWDRGRRVGFGIAGFIDINKDGRSDMEQLQSIIVASNGRVDASPDKEGKKQGEMKVDTRYLVLGEFPNDPRYVDYRTSWNELDEEAEALGVQKIALEEFLKLMGWQSDSRTVALAVGTRAEDFPPTTTLEPETPDDKTRTDSNLFKPRLPVGGY